MKREHSTGSFLSAVFVDYDNIYLSLKRRSDEAAKRFAKEAPLWIKAIEQGTLITPTNGLAGEGSRRIVMNRCYGNPVPRRNQSDNSTDMNSFPFTRHHFLRAGFEIIDCPPLTAQLKNSSDIRMVMDVRDYLIHETYFDEFVILSGDADFTPVLHRLRAHARRTVIYANDHTAAPYTAICDGEIREADLISLLLEGRIASEQQNQQGKIEPYNPQQARKEIMADVIAAVRASPAPMPLEALADRAVRQVGHDKTIGTAWGGAGGFRELLAQDLPAGLRLSGEPPYVVIDAARHIAAQPIPARIEVQAQPSAPVQARIAAKPQSPARAAVAAPTPLSASAPAQMQVTTPAQSQKPIQPASMPAPAQEADYFEDQQNFEEYRPPEVQPAPRQPIQRKTAQAAVPVPTPVQPPMQPLAAAGVTATTAPQREPVVVRSPQPQQPGAAIAPRAPAAQQPVQGQAPAAAAAAQRSRFAEAAAQSPVAAQMQPQLSARTQQAYSTTHQPARSNEPSPIHQSIARIHDACQAPPLAPPEYRMLFETMAQEINENGLIGAQTIMNIVQRVQEHGVDVRRDDVRFVLEVVSEADPWFEQGASANLFAGRFRNFVVARCRSQGLSLSADELDLIEAWFAGGSAPAHRVAQELPMPVQPPLQHGRAPTQMQQQSQPPVPQQAQIGNRGWSLEDGRKHLPEQRQVTEPVEPTAEDFPRIVRTRLRG